MDRDSLKDYTIFAIWGISFFWFIFFIPLAQGAFSTTWTVTDGTVLSSSIEINTEDSSSYKFRPLVVYSYEINGHTYNGNNIGFFTIYFSPFGFPDAQSAQKYIDAYPNGTNLDVYVNPLNPGEAVLEPGFQNEFLDYFLLLLSVDMLIVLFYFYLHLQDVSPFFAKRKFISTVKSSNTVNFTELEKLSPNSDYLKHIPKIFKPKVELRSNFHEKYINLRNKFGKFTRAWFILALLITIPIIVFLGWNYFYNNYFITNSNSIFDFLSKYSLIVELIIYHLFFAIYLFKFSSLKLDDKSQLKQNIIINYVLFPFIAFIYFGVALLILFLSFLLIPLFLTFWFTLSCIFFIPFLTIQYILTGKLFVQGLSPILFILSLILPLIMISLVTNYQDQVNKIIDSFKKGINYNKIFFNHEKTIYSIVTLNSDIISVSSNNKVMIIDTNNNDVEIIDVPHRGLITSLVLIPGSFLTSSLDKQVLIHQREKNTLKITVSIKLAHDSGILCQCLIDEKTKLVTGDQNGFLYFWSLKTHNLIKKFQAHNKGIIAIKEFHDYIITASLDNSIKMWHKKDEIEALDEILIHKKSITAIAIQDKLLVSGSLDKHLGILEIKQGKLEQIQPSIEMESPIHSMVFYQEKFLFLGLRNGDLLCIDVSNNFQTAKKWSISPVGIESLAIIENSLYSASLLGIIKEHVINSNLDISLIESSDSLTGWLDILQLSIQEKCQICWQEIDQGIEAKKCPNCGSNFHIDHLMNWFRKRKSCPLCLHQFAK
jgi:WD40 repeat protein